MLPKLILLIFCAVCVSACSVTGYYLDAINGHANILNQQRPVEDVLNDQAVSPLIREKLLNLVEARRFASNELLLLDNDSYRQYSDIKRQFVVWNVVATRPLSLKPKQWCYVFVGCMSYRGFFDEEKANNYANELQQQGWDVYVGGVKAYSTLGWFDDPFLNTMLYASEASRVGLLFHELAHQQVYRKNDSTFNESFATTVEQEGLRRWFMNKGNKKNYEDYLQASQRDQQFHQLLLKTQIELRKIYSRNIGDLDKLRYKNKQFQQLKTDYRQLKISWENISAYDAWMAKDLNNAHLALIATYNKLIPQFQTLLNRSGNNLEHFYQEVKNLSTIPPAQLTLYWCKFPQATQDDLCEATNQ